MITPEEVQMTYLQNAINAKAMDPTISEVALYWYKETAWYDNGPDFGELDLIGWRGRVSGTEDDTYCIAAYFDDDGEYKGPDCYGVYPAFELTEVNR